MSADLISLQDHRDALMDAQALRIAKLRRLYAEAKAKAEATLNIQDGIYAAQCFAAFAEALREAGREPTEMDALFPTAVSAGELAATTLAQCRVGARSITGGCDDRAQD